MATNGTGRLRVIIVEGDELTRLRLRALLASIEAFEALEDASTAQQAEHAIADARPDVVLLDLDIAGVATIRSLRAADSPCVIAMTAHPERALPALELEAVDYLLKPAKRERLAIGLARARRRIAERRIAELALEIVGTAAALRGGAPAFSGGVAHYPDQLTIRVRRRIFALPVADISWIEGANQYSRVHAKGGEYLLSRSLTSLECELDPAQFFRIHRSAIVNAAFVEEVTSRGDGRYNVYLRGGAALPLGHSRRETLRRLLGGIEASKGRRYAGEAVRVAPVTSCG